MMFRFFIAIISILLIGSVTGQNADTGSGWDVTENCVVPTTAPPDWELDGTVLVSDSIGIHAYHADWETPRVIIPLHYPANNISSGTLFGALSLDGQWYATTYGGSGRDSGTYSVTISVDELRIYNIFSDDVIILDPPNDLYTLYTNVPSDRVYWIDNSHLLFADLVFDIHTGEIVPSEFATSFSIYGGGAYSTFPSPDWTRTVQEMTAKVLLNIETDEILSYFPFDSISVEWSPDSTRFALLEGAPYAFDRRSLRLYDRDGQLLDLIYSVEGNDLITGMLWGLDNNTLIFWVRERETLQNQLYIADIQARSIVNTCLNSYSGAWSRLNENQIATLDNRPRNDGLNYLLIFDIEAQTVYPVANFIGGSIMAWEQN